eukprot:jgi/Mesvir1/18891/Mv18889-RA.1
MTFFTESFLLREPPHLAVKAYHKRAPGHPLLPWLVSIDVLEEKRDAGSGETCLVRRCALANDAPRWLQRVAGMKPCYGMEVICSSQDGQRATIESVNETLSSVVVMKEKCTYEPHPESNEWTTKRVELDIQLCSSFLGLSSALERFLVQKYRNRLEEGLEIDHKMIAAEKAGVQGSPSPSVTVSPTPTSGPIIPILVPELTWAQEGLAWLKGILTGGMPGAAMSDKGDVA